MSQGFTAAIGADGGVGSGEFGGLEFFLQRYRSKHVGKVFLITGGIAIISYGALSNGRRAPDVGKSGILSE